MLQYEKKAVPFADPKENAKIRVYYEIYTAALSYCKTAIVLNEEVGLLR